MQHCIGTDFNIKLLVEILQQLEYQRLFLNKFTFSVSQICTFFQILSNYARRDRLERSN